MTRFGKYLPYIKVCIGKPDNGLSIDQTCSVHIHVQALNVYVDLKLCQTEHVHTVTKCLKSKHLNDVWGYGLGAVEYLKTHTCAVSCISHTVIRVDFH